MNQTHNTVSPEQVVVCRHVYPATCQQVFAAFSSATALQQWFGPESHQAVVEAFDFSVGGRYQIRLRGQTDEPDCGETGVDPVCAGEYLLIEKDKKIAMTFNWVKGGGDLGESILTITLVPKNNGTELVLRHEPLPNPQLCQDHREGWQSTLESLQRFLIG